MVLGVKMNVLETLTRKKMSTKFRKNNANNDSEYFIVTQSTREILNYIDAFIALPKIVDNFIRS